MKGTPEQLDKTIYKLATEGYLYELRNLVRLVKSNEFGDILPLFSDYEYFLHSSRNNVFAEDAVDQLLKTNRTIRANDSASIVKKLFACANLSACCETFGGWTIPIAELEMSKTNEYLQLALNSVGANYDHIGRNMGVRLNKCDTARVIQPLKLLGLLRPDSQTCDQLSLCCSIGERDRHALHQTPHINSVNPATSLASQQYQKQPLHFSTISHIPKHIAMIDNDTILEPIYEQFNKEEDNLLAMKTDLYDGLKVLANKIELKMLRPRNLVVAFRLAPEAFPDSKRYLDELAYVINQEADLIMTIGAGDNLAEFTHRLKVMDNIFNDLTDRGMSPIRIKNCKGNSPKQQQLRLVYGLSQYASYETIYCRLIKKRLMQPS